MNPPLKIRLDETTYYSILGLSANASERDIHKSYVKLARELHPDKSKSTVAAELFKLISHAHSVLIDRDKKDQYDRTLISKGLLSHSPRRNYHRYEGATALETPSKPTRPQRPYEKQPYGFNTSNTPSPKVKVPIFQSFNLKNYQTKSHQSRDDERRATAPTRGKGVFKSESNVPKEKEQSATASPRGNDMLKSKSNTPKGGDGVHVNSKFKLHKLNPTDDPPNSPFVNHDQRHYARTKHEVRVQDRRSASPLKNTQTSTANSEDWDGLKDLLERFKDGDSKGDSPLKSQDPKREEKTWQDNEIQRDRIRKADSQSIQLDDLIRTLPRENNLFDMRNVGNSMPAVKRTKLDIRTSDEGLKQENNSSQNVAEPLYVPVNKPLPRIYRADHIPLDQYMINSRSLQWNLPSMPNFQCNVLNQSEMEHYKELVKSFNEEANTLKEQLLGVLNERLEADKMLTERLIKVENAANWVSSKDFDFEIVNKLGELQNRQRIVAQSFANLLRCAYASSQRNT